MDDFDDLDDGGEPRSRSSRAWLKPVVMLVIVVGVAGGGTFALKRFMAPGGVESTDGAPPLVKADELPTKTKPQEPGGMQIDNQDKTIYSQIGNGDPALSPPPSAPSAAGTMPAPETPLPRPTVPGVVSAPATSAPAAPTPAAPGEAPLPAAAPTMPVQTGSVETMAPTLPGSAAPPPAPTTMPSLPGSTAPTVTASQDTSTPPLPQGATKEPLASAATGMAIPPAPQPGGSGRTLSPPSSATLPPSGSTPLPPSVGTTAGVTTPPPAAPSAAPAPAAPAAPQIAAAPAPAAPAAAPVPVKPAAVAAKPAASGNGPKIQIGAFGSDKEAQQFWAARTAKYPDLLGNLTLHLEKVDSGPKAGWVRVQAGGLANRNAAQTVCSSLKAKGQDCIVTK